VSFFEQDFAGLNNLSQLKRKELNLIIQKIQHVVKISLVLVEQADEQPANICNEEYLHKVLSIV